MARRLSLASPSWLIPLALAVGAGCEGGDDAAPSTPEASLGPEATGTPSPEGTPTATGAAASPIPTATPAATTTASPEPTATQTPGRSTPTLAVGIPTPAAPSFTPSPTAAPTPAATPTAPPTPTAAPTPTPTLFPDGDGDGYRADVDCDDTEPLIHPGALELCDGVRDDCDDAAWTSDAGLARLRDGTTGQWSDLTATLGAGTAQSPVVHLLQATGALYLCEGTWYASLSTSGGGQLRGIGGTDQVIVDGGGKVQPFTSSVASAFAFQGLTFAHGYTAGQGGCLALRYATEVTVDQVKVEGCRADLGGGASFDEVNSLTITDSALTSNTAGTSGGGIYATRGTTLILRRTTLSGNEVSGSGGGGGLALVTQTIAALEDVTLTGGAALFGGGLYAEHASSVSATRLTASGNTSSVDGGGIWIGASTLTLTGGSVTGNTAQDAGGGIFVYQGGAAITGVTMNTNSPDDVNAGGSHSYTYSGVVTTICNSTQCQ